MTKFEFLFFSFRLKGEMAIAQIIFDGEEKRRVDNFLQLENCIYYSDGSLILELYNSKIVYRYLMVY